MDSIVDEDAASEITLQSNPQDPSDHHSERASSMNSPGTDSAADDAACEDDDDVAAASSSCIGGIEMACALSPTSPAADACEDDDADAAAASASSTTDGISEAEAAKLLNEWYSDTIARAVASESTGAQYLSCKAAACKAAARDMQKEAIQHPMHVNAYDANGVYVCKYGTTCYSLVAP